MTAVLNICKCKVNKIKITLGMSKRFLSMLQANMLQVELFQVCILQIIAQLVTAH